jgi:hypothetical protein
VMPAVGEPCYECDRGDQASPSSANRRVVGQDLMASANTGQRLIFGGVVALMRRYCHCEVPEVTILTRCRANAARFRVSSLRSLPIRLRRCSRSLRRAHMAAVLPPGSREPTWAR